MKQSKTREMALLLTESYDYFEFDFSIIKFSCQLVQARGFSVRTICFLSRAHSYVSIGERTEQILKASCVVVNKI